MQEPSPRGDPAVGLIHTVGLNDVHGPMSVTVNGYDRIAHGGCGVAEYPKLSAQEFSPSIDWNAQKPLECHDGLSERVRQGHTRGEN